MAFFSGPNCVAWRTCRNITGYDNRIQIRV